MAICEGSTANALTPFSSVKNNKVLLTTYNLIPEINNQVLYGWIKNNDEDKLRILQEKRDLIIEEVGKRQYDQLVKAYSFGNTDARSRSIVNKLKNKFIAQGITENTFMRYF